MENRINIAELLRKCPEGMELDCVLFDGVVFDEIDDDEYCGCPIVIKTKEGETCNLTSTGCWDDSPSAKCVIFPKGKTTWEGFVPPFKFKDGDILFVEARYDWIFIYKENENKEDLYKYVATPNYSDHGDIVYDNIPLCCRKDTTKIRLATEEERTKLFKALKNRGFKWNAKTKTLETLNESKEDTNDEIVMSGIYFDREYYADEVELHLGNYEIEIRNGKTYAVYKNQETKTDKLIKPIFKVGDKIKHKDTVLTIITVQTNSYIVEDEPDNFGILMFSQQDKWELINEPKFKVGDTIKNKGLDIVNPIEITGVTPKMYTFRDGSFQYVEIIDKNYVLISRKFDISSLKPYDKVLVRDTKEQVWVADLFSHLVNRPLGGYTFACVGHYPSQCIPYEGNEHLLGTTDDCQDFYKNW